jgi:hypothetical protein
MVGDASRRMTYAELADVRGISVTSARRLVLRHHWPRQTGNDGLVRVTVPMTALTSSLASSLASSVDRQASDVATTSPTTVAVTSERGLATDPPPDPVIVTLTKAVDSLREQLEIANARADRAEQRVDELIEDRRRDAGERRHLLDALTGRVPWWRRWFRR